MKAYVADNQKVQELLKKVLITGTKIAPRWIGQEGILLRWCHDDWYIVEVFGKELVLSIDEFTIIK